MKNKKEAQSAAEISADDNAQPQQRETDDGLATVEQNNAADASQNAEQPRNAATEPQASETDQSVDNAQADRTEQAQAVKEKRTAKQWLKYFAQDRKSVV